MSARKASSISRGILVALGCISAVWLILVNGNSIINYIKEFSAPYSFFEYFFSYRLANFATLFLGISFFAIIIRDLWGLKKPILWIMLVFSVLCTIAILFNLFINNPYLSSISFYTLFRNLSFVLMMIAYTVYAVVSINNRRHHPFGFFFGIFSALLMLVGAVLLIVSNNSILSFAIFVPDTLVFLANFFVFKCILYE